MTEYTNIHRFLDDRFADSPRTPENLDLKEELRGNLAARVAELESGGLTAEAASARAIDELGDIGELIESDDSRSTGGPSDSVANRLVQLNRVRLDPVFAIRIAGLAALVALAVAVALVWAVAGQRVVLDLSASIPPLALVILGAVSLGALVALSLRRETSQHFAVPTGRALRYGLASAVGFVGIALVAIFLGGREAASMLAIGGLGMLIALVLFIELGVTQTNRAKPWVKELQRSYEFADRFSRDPAAAARFGIYTIVIWIVAFALFAGLSLLVGFAWSWLALVAGLVAFFLVLARMLFPADAKERG